jgi:transcriptional regulator with XRE-family HTH domain
MLKVIRQNAGYSQQQVAKLLGHNNTVAVSDWENEKAMPNGTNLMKLCILYSKSPQELYPQYYQELSSPY